MKTPVPAACGAALMMALSACAGRAPQPVAVVQPQDRFADCAAVIAEVQANNQKIQDLAGDEGSKVAQNVAAGVVGLFIWPVWFGMDFQGAAGKEVAALQSRQQYLIVLAEQRNCAAPVSTPAATPAAPTAIPAPVAVSAHTATPIPTPAAPPTPAPSPPAPLPAVLTSVTPAPTPASAWPNIVPPLSPTAETATAFVAPAAPTPSPTPPPVPAPPQPAAAVSPPPQAPAATPDSYEQAEQQYRQAEQLYQRQLEQRAQGR